MKYLKYFGIFFFSCGIVVYTDLAYNTGNDALLLVVVMCIIIIFALVYSLKHSKIADPDKIIQEEPVAPLQIDDNNKLTLAYSQASNQKIQLGLNIVSIKVPADILNLLWIKGGTKSNYTDNLINEPSLIDLELDIEKTDNIDLNENIGYYPSYRNLSPKQRYTYLKWLEDITLPINIGYVFIFYYGLERHLIYGQFEAAFMAIQTLMVHHINSSFLAYSTDALIISSLYHRKYQLLANIDTSKSSNKVNILISYLTKGHITVDNIIDIRKSIGFTNDYYIKSDLGLFKSCLTDIIYGQYGTIYYPVTDSDFQNSKENCPLAIANYSLNYSERIAVAPDITSNKNFADNIFRLLVKTHETVKNIKKEERKIR